MKKLPAPHSYLMFIACCLAASGSNIMRSASALAATVVSPLSDGLLLPQDTAYIAPQASIDNRADSVTVSGRSFQGPGPYTVYFAAEISPAITYYAWEIASDSRFDDIMVQYHELEADYEFNEAGTYYARFTTSNADNTQETFGEPYTIIVTESLLEIPNLITPDSPSGNNRIFKVKYKSLRKFEMWVFNRWGNQLFHTTKPEEGWDGTQGGKPVPTGAYYYIVKAEGTDNIKYERKGDINVLRLKKSNNSGSQAF